MPLKLFLRHEGYEFIDGDRKYLLEIGVGARKDTIELETSTYRGLSIGATHFYGKLRLPSTSFRDTESGSTVFSGKMPYLLFKIELYRPISNRELEKSDRYAGYATGDIVPGFNSIEELVAHASFIKKEFFPGFRLKTEYRTTKEYLEAKWEISKS